MAERTEGGNPPIPRQDTEVEEEQLVVRKPEVSPELQQLIESQNNAGKALDVAVNDIANSEDPKFRGLWDSMKQEWRPLVYQALKEPEKSLVQEHEEMVGPISVLAFRAFKREDPLTAKSMDPEFLAANKREQVAALKAVTVLMERYANRVKQMELGKRDQKQTMAKLGEMLKQLESYADKGHRLAILAEMPERKDYRDLFELDTIIEEIGQTSATNTLGDVVTSYDQQEDVNWDERSRNLHMRDGIEVFPILKGLTQLRKAMSLESHGHEMSPNDLWKLVNTQASLKEG